MFRKGGFSLKKSGNTPQGQRLLLSLLFAVTVIISFSVLMAYLMQCGIVPIAWGQFVTLISTSLGAIAAGAVSGGKGRKGLLTGAVLAIAWCFWRLAANPVLLFRVNTLLEVGFCVLCSWIGSCIFHKNKKRNTKRNRRL